MNFGSILITGGAGFVGSNLATLFREAHPNVAIVAMDNLQRRGGELNLPRLRAAGVAFHHGDIRRPDDFDSLRPFDLLIDCSAEPSVHAGLAGSPRQVLDTNLVGTINCLEAARSRGAAFLFLSTSRIYPIAILNELPYIETETRFRWEEGTAIPGFSARGISEDFPINGARSFYGTSKLAGEQLIQEYVYSYGMRADRPMWHPRRPLADGQGGSRRHHALGCPPLFRAPAAIYRLWRPRQAGPRPPPRARPLRTAAASTRDAGVLGRPGLQRRGRGGGLGFAS